MPKTTKVQPLPGGEEVLELSGWLKSEVARMRSALRLWASGHTSDKSLCYDVHAGLSNLDQITGSLTSKSARDRLRKDLKEDQDEVPF